MGGGVLARGDPSELGELVGQDRPSSPLLRRTPSARPGTAHRAACSGARTTTPSTPRKKARYPPGEGVREVVVAAADLRPARETQVQPGADDRDAERDRQQTDTGRLVHAGTGRLIGLLTVSYRGRTVAHVGKRLGPYRHARRSRDLHPRPPRERPALPPLADGRELRRLPRPTSAPASTCSTSGAGRARSRVDLAAPGGARAGGRRSTRPPDVESATRRWRRGRAGRRSSFAHRRRLRPRPRRRLLRRRPRPPGAAAPRRPGRRRCARCAGVPRRTASSPPATPTTRP